MTGERCFSSTGFPILPYFLGRRRVWWCRCLELVLWPGGLKCVCLEPDRALTDWFIEPKPSSSHCTQTQGVSTAVTDFALASTLNVSVWVCWTGHFEPKRHFKPSWCVRKTFFNSLFLTNVPFFPTSVHPPLPVHKVGYKTLMKAVAQIQMRRKVRLAKAHRHGVMWACGPNATEQQKWPRVAPSFLSKMEQKPFKSHLEFSTEAAKRVMSSLSETVICDLNARSPFQEWKWWINVNYVLMDQGVNLMIIGYYLQLGCLSEVDPDTMIIQSRATPI